jgi:enediyne biosynthesis protein CalE5
MNDESSIKLKLEQRQGWDASAEGWARWWVTFERGGKVVSERLVAMAQVASGFRVLDIATGIGEPAETAARAVGPSGRVLATDQSSGMLTFARQRTAALGLHNLEFREADAETLAIDAADFDAILCRWGLMFLPDLDRALRRIHQLVRSGGWFATAVWATAAEVPMLSIAGEAVRSLAGLPAPKPGELGPLRLADTAILERALTNAGFRDLKSERVTVTFEFASPDEFVEFRVQVSHAFRSMLTSKPADLQEQIRTVIRDAARRYAGPDGRVRMANLSICVAGRK